MGEARNRGTFAERQQQAYKAIDADIEVRKTELEQLEEFEQRQNAAIGEYLVRTLESIGRNNERHPVAAALTRSDFSLIPLQNRT